MTEQEVHEQHLQQAIQVAKQNIATGGGPFGAVIIKDGQVISSAGNQVTTHNDPTAHAEVVAIRRACESLQTFDLSGCTLYSSCEPCPMCLGAIYWARLDKLFFAASREDAAAGGFDDSFIYDQIPLAVHERTLPTEQLLAEQGKLPFTDWLAKDDRTEY